VQHATKERNKNNQKIAAKTNSNAPQKLYFSLVFIVFFHKIQLKWLNMSRQCWPNISEAHNMGKNEADGAKTAPRFSANQILGLHTLHAPPPTPLRGQSKATSTPCAVPALKQIVNPFQSAYHPCFKFFVASLWPSLKY